jgi:hypothetical protein
MPVKRAVCPARDARGHHPIAEPKRPLKASGVKVHLGGRDAPLQVRFIFYCAPKEGGVEHLKADV